MLLKCDEAAAYPYKEDILLDKYSLNIGPNKVLGPINLKNWQESTQYFLKLCTIEFVYRFVILVGINKLLVKFQLILNNVPLSIVYFSLFCITSLFLLKLIVEETDYLEKKCELINIRLV